MRSISSQKTKTETSTFLECCSQQFESNVHLLKFCHSWASLRYISPAQDTFPLLFFLSFSFSLFVSVSRWF